MNPKRVIIGLIATSIVLTLLWQVSFVSEKVRINAASDKTITFDIHESTQTSTTPKPETDGAGSTEIPDPLNQETNKAISSLCLVSSARSRHMVETFVERYPYLQLSVADIEKILGALAATDFDDNYLPDYNNPIGPNGDASIALHSSEKEPKGVESENKTAKKTRANSELSASYFHQKGTHYDFSSTEFNRALIAFLSAYVDEPQQALMLLYLHMKSAGQQYWRYSTAPDWRVWVHFEHHRQALIWLIHKYGKPEAVRRINADVLLYSTINIFSGEPDRGYGPVLGARVEDAKAFYLQNLPQLSSTAAQGSEPENVSNNGMIKYDALENTDTQAAMKAIWPEGRSKRMEEFLLALVKECHRDAL